MKRVKKIFAAILTAALSFGMLGSIPSYAVVNHDNAVGIDLNKAKTDSFSARVTEKDYKIVLPADGYVTVSFSHGFVDKTDLYWKVVLENESGKSFFEQSYVGNSKETKTSRKYGLGEGTYYLRVSSINYSDQNYKLTVNYTPVKGWEREINDSFETASSIDYNTDTYGNLYDLRDTDFYKVTIPTAGYVSLYFDHDQVDTESKTDKYWASYLFDSKGNNLSNDEIYETYVGNSSDSVTGESIGVPAGTYYIQIRNVEKISSDVNYRLRFNYNPSNSWEMESNDTMEEANSFSVSDEITGKLAYKDTDIFMIDNKSPMGVKLSFSHNPVSVTGSYIINVFDKDEKPLITKQVSDFSRVDVLTADFELPKGITYFSVTSSDSTTAVSSVEYNISVDPLNCSWININKKSYWYENGVRQGTYSDAKGVLGDGTVRGREIFDPVTNAWYWLDSVYDGAKACNKEVWMPYVYQDEAKWTEKEMRDNANASIGMPDYVFNCMKNKLGKWVRYDANGKMIKGWFTVDTEELIKLYPEQKGNKYYYDPKTGIMVKGYAVIDAKAYYFDDNTGVLIKAY